MARVTSKNGVVYYSGDSPHKRGWKRVGFLATPDEKAQLEADAIRKGHNVSSYLRGLWQADRVK